MITFMQFVEAKDDLNRREFLKSSAAIPTIGLLGTSVPAALPAAAAAAGTAAKTIFGPDPFLSLATFHTLQFTKNINIDNIAKIIRNTDKMYIDQIKFALNYNFDYIKDDSANGLRLFPDFLTSYAGNDYNINNLGPLIDNVTNGMFTKSMKEITNNIGPQKIIQAIMNGNLEVSGGNVNVAFSALKNISEKIPAIGKIFNPSVFQKGLEGKHDGVLRMLKNNGIDITSLNQRLKEKELDLMRWEDEGGRISENKKNNFVGLAGRTYKFHDTNFIRKKKRRK